jgi:hypothetical protein
LWTCTRVRWARFSSESELRHKYLPTPVSKSLPTPFSLHIDPDLDRAPSFPGHGGLPPAPGHGARGGGGVDALATDDTLLASYLAATPHGNLSVRSGSSSASRAPTGESKSRAMSPDGQGVMRGQNSGSSRAATDHGQHVCLAPMTPGSSASSGAAPPCALPLVLCFRRGGRPWIPRLEDEEWTARHVHPTDGGSAAHGRRRRWPSCRSRAAGA